MDTDGSFAAHVDDPDAPDIHRGGFKPTILAFRPEYRYWAFELHASNAMSGIVLPILLDSCPIVLVYRMTHQGIPEGMTESREGSRVDSIKTASHLSQRRVDERLRVSANQAFRLVYRLCEEKPVTCGQRKRLINTFKHLQRRNHGQ